MTRQGGRRLGAGAILLMEVRIGPQVGSGTYGKIRLVDCVSPAGARLPMAVKEVDLAQEADAAMDSAVALCDRLATHASLLGERPALQEAATRAEKARDVDNAPVAEAAARDAATVAVAAGLHVGRVPSWTDDMATELALAMLLGRLEAPAFPRFYGAAGVGKAYKVALAMEYADEGSFASALTVPGRFAAQSRAWLFQLLWSLGVAQEKYHFDHRDIHDENILFKQTLRPLEQHYTLPGGREWTVPLVAGTLAPLLIDFGFASACAGREDEDAAELNPGTRDLASFPSPDLLFWPDGTRRQCGGDTWVLALVWFMAACVDGCLPAHGRIDLALHNCLHLGVSAKTQLFPRLQLWSEHLRHWLQQPETVEFATDRLSGKLSEYVATVLAVQAALGNPLLPPVTLVAPGQSPFLDALRAELPALLRLPVAFPVDRVSGGAPLVDLLRRLLQWETVLGRSQEEPVALRALSHAYFGPFRGSAGGVKRDVELQWFSLPRIASPDLAPLRVPRREQLAQTRALAVAMLSDPTKRAASKNAFYLSVGTATLLARAGIPASPVRSALDTSVTVEEEADKPRKRPRTLTSLYCYEEALDAMVIDGERRHRLINT